MLLISGTDPIRLFVCFQLFRLMFLSIIGCQVPCYIILYNVCVFFFLLSHCFFFTFPLLCGMMDVPLPIMSSPLSLIRRETPLSAPSALFPVVLPSFSPSLSTVSLLFPLSVSLSLLSPPFRDGCRFISFCYLRGLRGPRCQRTQRTAGQAKPSLRGAH